jgi:hypothetical protein
VPGFDNESRRLLVVFATKRGRGFCNVVLNGVPDANGAVAC